MLFKTIDSVLNSPQSDFPGASPELCNKFLNFFLRKVNDIRSAISAPASDPSESVPPSAVLQRFEPVSLSFLKDIINHMKPSASSLDAVSPRFFKQVFPSIGQFILTFVNSSGSSGVVPTNLKHAVVLTLLKRPWRGFSPALKTCIAQNLLY